MAAKKSTSKKPATRAKKKAPAKKKEVVKYTADQVVLTKAQQSSLNVIANNEAKIHARAQDMLKLAFDSGQRMLKLKDEVQNKFGRVWKEWAASQDFGVGYPQLTRYMKLAANPEQFALLTDEITSIEGAVKEIGYMNRPETRPDPNAPKAKPSRVPKATAGIISNATLDEIAACNDVDELQGVIDLCKARIDELKAGGTDPVETDADEAAAEADEDAADAVAELVG